MDICLDVESVRKLSSQDEVYIRCRETRDEFGDIMAIIGKTLLSSGVWVAISDTSVP